MTVKLVSSDVETWRRMFEEEKIKLEKVFDNNLVALHHIGSTSVPDLPAKPIIDILVEVDQLKLVEEDRLTSLGYKRYIRRMFAIPFREHYSRRLERDDGIASGYNVHIFPTGYSGVERHLMFRDHLRVDKRDRDEYFKVKEVLSEKYRDNVGEYAKCKSDFIEGVVRRSGFDKLHLLNCITPAEWQTYHDIRIKELFSKSNVDYDYNHFSLKLPEFYHFILKRGVDIIGVLTIEKPDNDSVAIIRSMAIVESEQGKGLGRKLMWLVERLCYEYGAQKMILHARLSARSFYEHIGFTETHFEEPAEKRLIQNVTGGDWEKFVKLQELKPFIEICKV